jgi:hypothetical protein
MGFFARAVACALQVRFRRSYGGANPGWIFAAPLQWSMAAYFFKQFRVFDASVYLRLLRELVGTDQNIAFVTLNYETLLFQAAPKVGMTLSIGAEQRVGTTFPLVLPHGSSILKCIGVSGTRGVSFTGVSTSGSVSIMQGSHEFDQERAKNVFPPVMSYFEPNKFTVSCANFIDEHRKLFGRLIARAERIAIVGVNVHPIDKHIWEPIAKTGGTCFYLGGQAGGDT